MFERSKKAVVLMQRLTVAAALPALFILSLFCLAAPMEAEALYIVSNAAPVRVDELEGSVFLTDGAAGLVSRTSESELKLAEGLEVTVSYEGQQYDAISGEETLSELLARLDIQPSPLEMLSVSFPDGGVEVEIGGEFVFYEHISTVSEHDIEYRYDDCKPDWYEAVVQEGSDGEYTEIYEIIYQDGQQTARQLIDVIDEEPVPTIIVKGTMENFANNDDEVAGISVNEDGTGVITLANGETVTFSSVRSMRDRKSVV